MVTATKRTPVVFVHGWAGSAESWQPVLDLLDPRAWSTTAVRLPGSPGSDETAATVRAAAGQLVRVLSVGSEPALIVGHSMGAQVTMLAHGDAPSLIRGEVVVDPAYGAAASQRFPMAQWATRIESQGHAAVADFFQSATNRMPSASAQRLIDDLHGTSATTIASYLRSEYVDADAIGLLPATGEAASRRSRPVLSMHSTADSVDRERALPQTPGSSTHRWRGHGHFLHLEDPVRFVAELTRWNDELRRTPAVLASSPAR